MKFQARNNYLINWPEYPLLRITICFIIGIYLSDSVAIPLVHSMLVTGFLLVALVLSGRISGTSIRSIRISSFLVLLLGISLGVLRGNLQKVSNNPFHYSNHLTEVNELVGKIISEPKNKKRTSAIIKIDEMNGSKCNGRLLVYFSTEDSILKYQIGDVLYLKGRIQRLKDNPNPMSFNYKDFLKYKGVDFQLFLRQGMHFKVTEGKVNLLFSIAQDIRHWALSIFSKRLKDKDHLATASAMVLGYKEFISRDLYTTFSDTGAVHVLAVSGLHVGIICMIFMFLFSKIRNDSNIFKTLKLVTLLSVVWIYALVTGASPAVLRAAVMFSLILIGRLWFSGTNIYNILACSALFILLHDPYLLFQLSFQFSYLALISIVFFQPLIERLYETKHWISTRIWQLTTVSIAAQILVFPISVYHFHQFPTYFILSGISAVFLATFVLGLGLILLCLHNIPQLGDGISILYSGLLEGFIQIISTIQSLPYNNVDDVYFSSRSVVVLYLLIGACMFFINIKPKSFRDVWQKNVSRKRIARIVMSSCLLFLFSNNIIYEYKTKNLEELIVYDISKQTAIDIFHAGALFSMESENRDEDKIDFARKSYRIYNGNPEASSLIELGTKSNEYPLHYENGSLIFKKKHFYFVHQALSNNIIPCESDILLVTHHSTMLPYKILENHFTSLVVLDNSLSFKIKNQWLRECKLKGIEVHDIRRDGVYRF